MRRILTTALLIIALFRLASCGKEEKLFPEFKFSKADLIPLSSYVDNQYLDRLHFTWSPDATMIVYPYFFDLMSIAPEGGDPVGIVKTSGWACCPQFYSSEASMRILFLSDNGDNLVLYTGLKGAPYYKTMKTFESWIEPSWYFDGTKIVYYYTQKRNDGIFWIPATGGDSTQIPREGGWKTVNIRDAHTSPTGPEVIFIFQEGSDIAVQYIGLSGGNPVTIHDFGERGDPGDPMLSISYDGSMIACISDYLTEVANLFLIPRFGGEPILLTEFTEERFENPYCRPGWSPDGKSIVLLLGANEIYRLELKL
jgi:Tol biopolymer transport system component